MNWDINHNVEVKGVQEHWVKGALKGEVIEHSDIKQVKNNETRRLVEGQSMRRQGN